MPLYVATENMADSRQEQLNKTRTEAKKKQDCICKVKKIRMIFLSTHTGNASGQHKHYTGGKSLRKKEKIKDCV